MQPLNTYSFKNIASKETQKNMLFIKEFTISPTNKKKKRKKSPIKSIQIMGPTVRVQLGQAKQNLTEPT